MGVILSGIANQPGASPGPIQKVTLMTWYDMTIKINCLENFDLNALEKFGEKLSEMIDNMIDCLPDRTISTYVDVDYEITDHRSE